MSSMSRSAHSYISDLESLKTWFYGIGKPNWKLMRGFQESTKDRVTIYQQSDEMLDLDESWALLEQMISLNCSGGGRFTVFVPTMANGKGALVLVQIGDFSTSQYPALAGYPGQMGGMLPAAELESRIKREREMWELRRELEDLRAAQEASAGIGEILIEKLREVDLAPIIQGIAQVFTRPGVAVHGTPGDFYAPPQAAPPPGAGEEGYTYEGNRLIPLLDSIRQHFSTNEEFFDFLGKVAQKFSQNPGLYKTLLQ